VRMHPGRRKQCWPERSSTGGLRARKKRESMLLVKGL